jgi:choline-glycine betaine transporter
VHAGLGELFGQCDLDAAFQTGEGPKYYGTNRHATTIIQFLRGVDSAALAVMAVARKKSLESNFLLVCWERMCVCVQVCVCVCMYVCMCVYACVCDDANTTQHNTTQHNPINQVKYRMQGLRIVWEMARSDDDAHKGEVLHQFERVLQRVGWLREVLMCFVCFVCFACVCVCVCVFVGWMRGVRRRCCIPLSAWCNMRFS